MKKNLTHTTRTPGTAWLRFSGNLIIVSVFFTGLTSCTTAPPKNLSGSRSAGVKARSGDPNGKWVLASKDPAIFHPQGLENANYQNGKWIATMDPDVKWFIPSGGVDGRSEADLEKEALAMRSELQEGGSSRSKMAKLNRGWFVNDSLINQHLDTGARASAYERQGYSPRDARETARIGNFPSMGMQPIAGFGVGFGSGGMTGF